MWRSPRQRRLQCANCKNSGHPASYYGCPYPRKTSLTLKKIFKKIMCKRKSKLQSIREYLEHGTREASIPKSHWPELHLDQNHNTLFYQINITSIIKPPLPSTTISSPYRTSKLYPHTTLIIYKHKSMSLW